MRAGRAAFPCTQVFDLQERRGHGFGGDAVHVLACQDFHIGCRDGGVAGHVEGGALDRECLFCFQIGIATNAQRAAHIAAREGICRCLRSTKDAPAHTRTGGHRFGLCCHLIFTGNDVQIATGLDVGIACNGRIGTSQGDVIGCFGLQVAADSQSRLDLVNRLSFLSRDCRCPNGARRARFVRSVDIPDGVKGDVATGLQIGIVTRTHLRTDVFDVTCRFEGQVVGRRDACGLADGGLTTQLIATVLAEGLVVNVALYGLHRHVVARDLARDVVDVTLSRDVQIVLGLDGATQVVQGGDFDIQIFGRDDSAVLRNFFQYFLRQIDLRCQDFLALHHGFNHPNNRLVQSAHLLVRQRLTKNQAQAGSAGHGVVHEALHDISDVVVSRQNAVAGGLQQLLLNHIGFVTRITQSASRGVAVDIQTLHHVVGPKGRHA